jgi:hypothetical protein
MCMCGVGKHRAVVLARGQPELENGWKSSARAKQSQDCGRVTAVEV